MPKSKELPSQEQLFSLFYLDEDFELYRKTGKNKGARVFDTIRKTKGGDYYVGSIGYEKYYTHRIIWKMYYGYDPDILDHIDGNTKNNNITNLRNVTQGKNMRNTKLPTNNTSGIIGVTKSKSSVKPWRAQITDNNGRKINLGDFTTKREAMQARKEAELKYGYTENHGRGEKLFDLDFIPDYIPYEFNDKTIKREALVFRAEVLRMPHFYLRTNSEQNSGGKYSYFPVMRHILKNIKNV